MPTTNTTALEAAAKKLAEVFDYPWEHMPEQGRENMRKNVRAVIEALESPAPSAAEPVAHTDKNAAFADWMQHGIEIAGEAVDGFKLNAGVRDVLIERQRQISIEGWSPEHDDEHSIGEMARAAACYANPDLPDLLEGTVGFGWPWDPTWWKPASPRRNLVKAGALILAEIERLDRATGSTTPLGAPPAPAPSAEPECSCPSGDGSLRWPCKVHPAAPSSASEREALTDELNEVVSWAEKMGAIGHPDRAAAAIRELAQQRLQTPDEAAHRLAAMVTEWVDTGIKMGTDWRSGLAGVIARRLSRAALHSTGKPDGEVAAQPWIDQFYRQHGFYPSLVQCFNAGRAAPADAPVAEPVAWLIKGVDSYRDPVGGATQHVFVNKRTAEERARSLDRPPPVPLFTHPPAPEDAKGAEFPPSQKLMELADRIDHEHLWARAGIDHSHFTQEQKDRMNAGVHLRRYAGLMSPEAWRIFPPRPTAVCFRAATLDRAAEMARADEERRKTMPQGDRDE